ncbi:hypothetical protein Scep_014836 [Stephania cephalantha]|uniref:Uncharacterized protein n=1 Tax=Stephania cephalantha TaxID=152367 RepID=A0AAP0J2S6_9MAGN
MIYKERINLNSYESQIPLKKNENFISYNQFKISKSEIQSNQSSPKQSHQTFSSGFHQIN